MVSDEQRHLGERFGRCDRHGQRQRPSAVQPNSGAPRTTTLTIAGELFMLSQEGACQATIKPTTTTREPDLMTSGFR